MTHRPTIPFGGEAEQLLLTMERPEQVLGRHFNCYRLGRVLLILEVGMVAWLLAKRGPHKA